MSINIMELKYSVIIVTYNRISLLKECVDHVLNQTFPVYEILIVNNNSTDGTKEYLEELCEYNLQIKVINLRKNLGGTGGFYVGMKNVSEEADYLLIIDDDAILSLDYLEKINEHMEKEVLAYSGTVKTDGKIHTIHRRRLRDPVLLKPEPVHEEEYQLDSFYYDVTTFCGLVISTSLVTKIGLPEKEYFIWHDDFEYSLRIIQYSLIKNVNSAILNHKTTIRQNNKLCWKDYYSMRNFIDLGRKHSKRPYLFLMYKYSVCFIKMSFCGILSLFPSSQKKYWKNCFLLRKQVIADSLHHKLGVSDVFYPGKEI